MTDDRSDGPEWPINRRRDRIDTAATPETETRSTATRSTETNVVKPRRGGINPIFVALAGVILLVLLLWLFLGRGNSDQDKLTGGEATNTAAAANPEKLCSSAHTYDLIKSQLFRQAAQVRGSDQAAFDRLSAYAVLRMQNPVMESDDDQSHRVSCSGSASLDLPPGVGVAGGRRTLSSDIDYSVQPAADGTGNVVLLRNADAIVTPLATLARIAQPQQTQAQPTGDAGDQPQVPAPPVVNSPPPAPSEPASPPAAAQPPAAQPSFNCDRARTDSEKAVCGSPALASLDRQMATQFGRAMSNGDPSQRALLQRTGERFLSYREHCGSAACIADAYRGRMREIRDIMNGDWSPPR